jgi:RNA polymerase sigma factor (sigma-70 family)
MNPESHKTEIAAKAEVFLDHVDFIRKIICFYIHDEQQADDVFQDFFLSFISHPLPVDIQKIEPYLYKAIANDIVDTLRHKDCDRKSMYEYSELSARVWNQKTPEEAVLLMDEMSRIFNLIERRLPRIEAQAVCLQYRDNLSAKEIAEKMDVGAATIRGYVSKGLGRIRCLLDMNCHRL